MVLRNEKSYPLTDVDSDRMADTVHTVVPPTFIPIEIPYDRQIGTLQLCRNQARASRFMAKYIKFFYNEHNLTQGRFTLFH
jgi:hypothetical protein